MSILQDIMNGKQLFDPNMPLFRNSYQTPQTTTQPSPTPTWLAPLKAPWLAPLKPEVSTPTPTPNPTPTRTIKEPVVTPVNKPDTINPATGRRYTPEERAKMMNPPTPQTSGELGAYSYNSIVNPNPSVEDLTNQSRTLVNSRNDLATGTVDPYKIGAQSGIPYTAEELNAIEKAAAGMYDPAINSVLTKLEMKQKEDALRSDQDFEMKKLAKQHEYALSEKSAGGGSVGTSPTSYKEWMLAGGLEGTGKTYADYLSGAATGPSFKSEVAQTGREAVKNMLKIAEGNKKIFGKSAAAPIPNFARSDDFRNYSAQLDTLKGNIIPAALTAMREASKTGGALGQVSDREGAWLSASLGAIDMAQSADQVIEQLKQIDTHLANWQNALDTYGDKGKSGTLTSPDGTQEVDVAELTPSELEEAKAAGWQ